MRPLWLFAVLGVAGLAALASASPKPVVFPDDPRAASPGAGAGYAPRQGYGPQQQQQQQDAYRNSGGAVQGEGRASSAYRGFAAAEATATPLPPPQPDSRVLLQQHKRKKKKRKKICNLASLLAGRDAAGGAVAADGQVRALQQQQQQQQEQAQAQHRAARAVPGPSAPQQGVGVEGDGRSYGSGLGLAGFVLGTLVGSKLGYGFNHQYPVQQGGHPPTFTQTQTQVQVPVQPVQPVQPVVPVAPIIPVIPVEPAPVHEDYDDVDQDDPVVGGSPGYSLCDQLQNRPDPGPLDSHFPLIHGILNGQGGQGQRPVAYRPQRPPAYNPYGPYRPPHLAVPSGGLLYNYIKPWTDLFFK